MFKLRRYLKPFIFPVLMIIVLLFGQAMCELKMPDYMSDIVNVGIHSNGIKDGVFDVIREKKAKELLIFMDNDEKEIFSNAYELINRDTATKEQLKQYPVIEKEPVYLLTGKDKENHAKLKEVLGNAETLLMGITQAWQNAENGENTDLDKLSKDEREILEILNKIPKDTDLFTVLTAMPKSTLEQMKDKMKTIKDAMGENTLDTANAKFVYMEYKTMGIDVASMQYRYLFKKGAAMLLVAFAASIAAVSVVFLASRIAAGVGKKLRHDVFHKVTSFSSAEYNKFSTNTLITRTTNDIQQTQFVLVMMLRVVIYAPIMGIGAVLKVIRTNADMTWIIGLVIAVIIGIMITAFLTVMPKYKILQKLMDRLNGIVREMLDGLSVIRAFNNEKKEESKFEEINEKITKTNLFTSRAMSMLMPLVMLIMNGTTILIVWVGSHQIDAGFLQIGDMMAFMQYAMQIIMAFMMITMLSIMIPRASVAAGRVSEILETSSTVTDCDKPRHLESCKGMIEFKNVSFRYPEAEEYVLQHISFTAEPAKTTAFIGSTGSGKSTLINLIPRFYDVSDGEILINGVDIRDVTQHELREHIGYVPQKGMLFSGTIASNLSYANEDATIEDMEKACEIAQAMEFIDEHEDKFDRSIVQQGTNISGGQRQRLSIARALVKRPDIYIFDDTFSALDFKTDAKLRKALHGLCQETQSTVFIVAQRISTIMHADQIIVLDEGKIADIGTHEELMKSSEVYREIAYSQLTKEELDYE